MPYDNLELFGLSVEEVIDAVDANANPSNFDSPKQFLKGYFQFSPKSPMEVQDQLGFYSTVKELCPKILSWRENDVLGALRKLGEVEKPDGSTLKTKNLSSGYLSAKFDDYESYAVLAKTLNSRDIEPDTVKPSGRGQSVPRLELDDLPEQAKSVAVIIIEGLSDTVDRWEILEYSNHYRLVPRNIEGHFRVEKPEDDSGE